MAADSCANLKVETLVNLDTIDPNLASALARAVPNAPPDLKFNSYTLQTAVEILTEPKRLLPHVVKTSRSLKFTFSQGGEAGEAVQEESRETRYEYL